MAPRLSASGRGPLPVPAPRVAPHDRRHLELKLDYPLSDAPRQQRFTVEAYLFVPAALGLSRQSYPPDRFYGDLQTHTRFQTPLLPAAVLTAADDPRSPFGALHALAARLAADPADTTAVEELCRAARLFGCFARASFHDFEERIRAALGGSTDVTDAATLVDTFLTEHGAITACLRRERQTSGLPPRARETLSAVDDYLGMVALSRFARLVDGLDHAAAAAHPVLGPARAALAAALRAERTYRSAAGFALPTADPAGGQHYVWWRGFLKKFVTSVLWLHAARERHGTGLVQFVAALAAGFAMLLVLIVGLKQQAWAMDTWPFIVTAVLAYMAKDRVKEWLRTFLTARLARFLSDYDVCVTDPLTGRALGRSHETYRVLPVAAVPDWARAERHATAQTDVERCYKPESVLKYAKTVTVDTTAVAAHFAAEHYDIRDIVRIDLGVLLARADDAEADLPVYDEATDGVVATAVPKVYHVNAVVALRGPADAAPAVAHARVILDQTGIREVVRVR